MPMDLALKEACFKGSLLDRVASLEERLSQVKNLTYLNFFLIFF